MWAHPVLGEDEVPEPQIEHPQDVIIRVAYCGICGTDLHCSQPAANGMVSFGGAARFPVVLGHEFTGTIVRTGTAVTSLAVGDLVAAESVSACWECTECRAGHLNECERGELLGLTVNGAMAPLVRVDARHCYAIGRLADRYGRDQALRVGTLIEPLGVAHRGLTRAALRTDDRLVVVGLGPIGLGVIQLAKAAGVAQIVAFDPLESRVALARAAGADACTLASMHERNTSPTAVVIDRFGARASLVVEAAGTTDAFELAFAALGPRGRLLVLGRMPERVPFDTNRLLSSALTVIGSRGHAGADAFGAVINKIADGVIDPSPLLTACFDFADAQAAFAHARSGSGAKTIVRVEG